MKKLLLFLLLIPTLLNCQTVEYFPKRDANYALIAGQDNAYAVILPTNYTPAKKWPWMMSLHGVGERGGGTLKHLQSLVNGDDYNGDGKIDARYFTAGMIEAVNKYGIVIVIPTYESNAFFDANKTHWVWQQVIKKFSLDSFYHHDGFSYGGGATLAAITSPLTAPYIIYATPCSPTRSISNISLIKQYNIPVHIFVNNRDDNGSTNLSVTKKIVTDINNTNPSVKTIYTAFDRAGHSGSHEDATTIAPPKAPGGEGFIDAGENMFEVHLDIRANGPRQMRSGAVIPIPIPEPIPITTLKADFNLSDSQVITTSTLNIDASTSAGVAYRWDAYQWDTRPFTGTWNYRLESGAYTDKPKQTISGLTNGSYSIKLTVRDASGKTASKSVTTIVKLGVAKIPVSFDSQTDLITYSDGSTEKGTAVFSGGKWVVKNSAGTIINL